MTIGAYALIEPTTGFVYYGSSQDVEKRIRRHYYDLMNNNHYSTQLQELWNKFGYLKEIVYPQETREDAYALEQTLIDSNLDNPLLLNIGLSIKGGDNFTRHPDKEEIYARIRQTVRTTYGAMSPEERIEKFSRPGELNPMYGKTHDPQAIQKIKDANVRYVRPRGLKRSERTKQLLSENAKKRIGEKNSFFGKTHGDVAKEKIRQSRLGQTPANAIEISINGRLYRSMKEACAGEGISYPTLVKRLKHPKYFQSKCPTTSESTLGSNGDE